MTVRRDVAFFLPRLTGGGAEQSTLLLAEGLSERGWNVELVVAERGGEFVHRLDASVKLRSLGIPLGGHRLALATLPLAAYLRRHRPSVLVSGMTLPNIVSIAASRLAGSRTKAVVVERSTLSQSVKHARRAPGRWKGWLAQRMYPYAERIVAVSHGVKTDLLSYLHPAAPDVSVIYNPFVVPDVLPKDATPPPHPWLDPREDIPVIVGMGRLHPAKGFDLLIEAFAQVRKRTHARLLILGEGSERPVLERMLETRDLLEAVQLPGFVSEPNDYLRRASLFVLSSRYEGLPRVLIESLAVGCPVVSTDCPSGPREILQDGAFGRLSPVGDALALSAAILAALDDSHDAERLRRRALDFSYDRSIAEYDRLLRDLVG